MPRKGSIDVTNCLVYACIGMIIYGIVFSEPPPKPTYEVVTVVEVDADKKEVKVMNECGETEVLTLHNGCESDLQQGRSYSVKLLKLRSTRAVKAVFNELMGDLRTMGRHLRSQHPKTNGELAPEPF